MGIISMQEKKRFLNDLSTGEIARQLEMYGKPIYIPSSLVNDSEVISKCFYEATKKWIQKLLWLW